MRAGVGWSYFQPVIPANHVKVRELRPIVDNADTRHPSGFTPDTPLTGRNYHQTIRLISQTVDVHLLGDRRGLLNGHGAQDRLERLAFVSDEVDDSGLGLVLELEQELQTKACRSNRARVRKLLAPDFIEVGASGRVWDRPSVLDLLASQTNDDEEIAVEQLTGRMLGEGFALVRWDSASQGRRARRTSLWRCTNGRWQLVHHQGTVLED